MNYDPNQQWQPGQQPPPPPQWTTQPGQWQQSPYAQPTQQQPSMPPPYYPQQPPPRKPNGWQSISRANKIALGLTFLVALVMCGICSRMQVNPPQTASVPTVTAPATVQATPTVQPTATSKPKPTLTSRPVPTKPVPVVQPTTKPVAPKPVLTQPPAPTPKPQPTQPPAPTYNTNPAGGQLVYNPPADFCGNNACVSTFWTATSGYVVECANGEYSHSGGVRGACSRDGGVAATLYQHG